MITVMPPSSLDDLAAITSPVDRALACRDYIAAAKAHLNTVRSIRDDAIGALIAFGDSDAVIARKIGMSEGHVKNVRRFQPAQDIRP